MPQIPTRLVVAFGLLGGLTLSIRVGGVIILFYIVLLVLIWIINLWFQGTQQIPRNKKTLTNLSRLAARLILAGIIAYLVMLVFWPAAQISPIKQPAKGILYANRFEYDVPVFFEGQYISNTELPWYYLLRWFLNTLPEFYFIAFIAGLIALILAFLAWRKSSQRQLNYQALGILVLAFSAGLPLLYSILTSPPNFDGVRHFLFVIPSLAILAAIGIVKLLERFNSTAARLIIITPIAGLFLITIFDMVQLHPYQYIYFNRLFAGGMVQAAQNYETDYWGASYKEGVEWLIQKYPQANTPEKVNVASCLYPLSTSYFLPKEQFNYLGSYDEGPPVEGQPEIILATTRWGCDKNHPGEVIHTISRMNVPLLYIIRIKSPNK